ncbi:MAG: 50S ribosomal protein L25 [Anaerolineae bacterium]
MEEITLTAQPRTVIGKQVAQLRRSGYVPAVVYGHNVEPQPLQVEERALRQVLQHAGGNQLITLRVGNGGSPRMVLLREVQREAIKRRLLHVDLYEVSMTERIRTEIPVTFTGEAPATKRGEAMLYHGLESVEVECLPGDLVTHFEVDLSGLTDIDQEIRVSDLHLGDKFQLLSDPDAVLVRVIPVQEQAIEEVTPTTETEVEVIKRERPEEEEG